jgi:eukaryotic-like serine/threonine-protein kinase
MANIRTAEQLAQRALDVNVVDETQLQAVWSEMGSRNVPPSVFQQALLRRGLLTQYQLDRLMRGLRTGFFYDDYKVQYCVGAGTFARVFRATHRVNGQMFAVKVLRSRYSNPKTEPKNSDIIDMFRREGELGNSLIHPNIVPIHEVVSHGTTHYIVMDFIEGRNLREFYRARRRFAPVEAANIVAGIMAGLSYALQQGVTHRDLKMSNVLVSSEGDAKLVDFGLAGLNVDDEDLGEGANPRTKDYAGLERATGVRKDDTRSDIFFAGNIFYQLLSGVPGITETRDQGQQMGKSRFQNIVPIQEVAPRVPFQLAMIVHKAMEFDPERRYQTPADMLMDIKLAIKRLTTASEAKQSDNQSLASSEGLDPSGQPRRLMVVESDVKMQDMLRDIFKRNGYRVLVSSDPERVMQRFFSDQQAADLVLFTTGSNGRAALNVFNRFGSEIVTRDLPAVLLLDQQHIEWEKDAQVCEHRVVAKMPIKLRQLRELLVEVLQKKVS